MMQYISLFGLAFIPLFVAIDPLGMVPVFMGLTDGLAPRVRRKLLVQATITAFVISMIFLFSGRLIFEFLGITENDFRIGGGIVLLVLAVTDLCFANDEKSRRPEVSEAEPMIGIVPLGIPLIMGPAALTTVLITVDAHGYILTTLALIVNMLIVWLLFRQSDRVVALIGPGGAKAFAKVTSLFMAAIAVMMIRVGVASFIGGHG